MRVLFAICLLMSLGATAAPSPPQLLGTWKSDRALTMEFANKNNKLLPKTERFWGEMVGRLTVTITSDSIRSELPDWDVEIDGNKHHMVGFSVSSSYEILYASPKTVVMLSENPVTRVAEPTTFNFTGPNTFWIYNGDGEDESPGSHLREYFKRVRQ